MEHVVFFTGTSGEPEFRRVGDLEQAVGLVESLRNEQGIADVTLHALTPVPVSFRTYYRVEIGGTAEQAPAVPEPAPQEQVAAALPVLEDAEAERAEALDVPSFDVPSFDVHPVEVQPSEVAEFEAEFETEALPQQESEQADELESAAGYEPVVPRVRTEPTVERSLGYFAS